MQHPGQRAHGERAAAEAEQIQPVTRLVPVHEEPVGILYVLLEPGAERLSQRAAHPPSECPAEKAEGSDARIVEGDLVRVANDRFVQLHDVGIVRAVFVARAVTAHDNVPGHGFIRLMIFAVESKRSPLTDRGAASPPRSPRPFRFFEWVRRRVKPHLLHSVGFVVLLGQCRDSARR